MLAALEDPVPQSTLIAKNRKKGGLHHFSGLPLALCPQDEGEVVSKSKNKKILAFCTPEPQGVETLERSLKIKSIQAQM